MVRTLWNNLASLLANPEMNSARTRRGRRFAGGLALEGLEGRLAPSSYTYSYGIEEPPPVEVQPTDEPATYSGSMEQGGAVMVSNTVERTIDCLIC